jgi:NitT/TauT family transport system permease protein
MSDIAMSDLHDEDEVPAEGWFRSRPELVCVPLLFLVIVAIWEFAIDYWEVPLYVAPPPSAILHSLIAGFSNGLFVSNALTTLAEALFGFAIAAIAGLVLGTLIAQSRFVERVLYPYLIAIQTTPKVAVAPLFIIWFGFGITSKVIMAALVAFFPILVNVITGLRATDVQKIELMRSLRASRWQIFSMVQLPSAMPMIFAGLHIGVIFSILGAIVGEFVGSRSGLGNLILQMNVNLDTAGVFAALVLLSVIGIVLHLSMHWLQRRVLFWADENQVPGV